MDIDRAIDYFYMKMESGQIKDDIEQEVFELAIKALEKQDDYKKLTELAKLKAMGKLVEVVYCEECKKIMTSDCPMCSFNIDGFCTGGPDNDGYCFLGER